MPQCPSPSRQAPQCAIATQCTVPPQAHHRAVSLLFVSFLLACACAHEPTSAAPLFCVASALLCDTRLEHMPFKLQAIARGKGVSQHHQVAKTRCAQVLTSDSRRGSDIEVVRCTPVSGTCLQAGGRSASTYKLPIPILVAFAVLWPSWGPGSLILADSEHYCT